MLKVIAVPQIYDNKQTKSDGVGGGLFTTAINPAYHWYNHYISHLIGPLLLLL